MQEYEKAVEHMDCWRENVVYGRMVLNHEKQKMFSRHSNAKSSVLEKK